jgi:hypothetical protein
MARNPVSEATSRLPTYKFNIPAVSESRLNTDNGSTSDNSRAHISSWQSGILHRESWVREYESVLVVRYPCSGSGGLSRILSRVIKVARFMVVIQAVPIGMRFWYYWRATTGGFTLRKCHLGGRVISSRHPKIAING